MTKNICGNNDPGMADALANLNAIATAITFKNTGTKTDFNAAKEAFCTEALRLISAAIAPATALQGTKRALALSMCALFLSAFGKTLNHYAKEITEEARALAPDFPWDDDEAAQKAMEELTNAHAFPELQQ